MVMCRFVRHSIIALPDSITSLVETRVAYVKRKSALQRSMFFRSVGAEEVKRKFHEVSPEGDWIQEVTWHNGAVSDLLAFVTCPFLYSVNYCLLVHPSLFLVLFLVLTR